MDNIIINKEVASGAPTVMNRRLTVFNVISKIYYEDTLVSALEDYEISVDIAKDAVRYCSGLKCQRDPNLIKFCSGCILRTLQDGWNFRSEDYDSILVDKSKIAINKNGQEIFLGSLKELEDNEFGLVGWLLASSVKEKYPELS
jgi:uncharacterized protein (DUF433 family)